MENREQIVAEYFNLRVFLNRANLKKDESTEIDFIIEQSGKGFLLLAALKGSSPSKNLQLCSCNFTQKWQPSGYFGFPYLEDFFTNFLNSKGSRKADLNHIREALIPLKNELRSLWLAQ